MKDRRTAKAIRTTPKYFENGFVTGIVRAVDALFVSAPRGGAGGHRQRALRASVPAMERQTIRLRGRMGTPRRHRERQKRGRGWYFAAKISASVRKVNPRV